jgi:lipid A 4'-phosphatase
MLKYFTMVLFLLFSIILYYTNLIDLFLAKIPYNARHNMFYGENSIWCQTIYYAVPVIVTTLIILNLLSILTASTIFYKKYFKYTRKQALIVLMALSIGPGVVINSLLKNNWGRPRPYQVIRDNKQFRSFYQPNFGSVLDNSFPSGHASIGFFLGIPLLVMGRRKAGLIVATIGGTIVGIVRILQGGHYFSDILFAGIIVWLLAELINYLMNRLS